MSCYTRHLGDLLPPDPTPDDKRALDRAVRRVVDLSEADCPEVWAAVKERREDAGFAPAVLAVMKEH
ncbi:MAG TPA: hypothetical protein VFI59_08380 [Actinomycetota bacterium]|nr:hypothetical protein [Actinomycetota bacterium]